MPSPRPASRPSTDTSSSNASGLPRPPPRTVPRTVLRALLTQCSSNAPIPTAYRSSGLAAVSWGNHASCTPSTRPSSCATHMESSSNLTSRAETLLRGRLS